MGTGQYKRIGGDGVTGRSLTSWLQHLAGVRDAANLCIRSTNFGSDGLFLDAVDTAGPCKEEGWHPWTLLEMPKKSNGLVIRIPTKRYLSTLVPFFFHAGLQSGCDG